MELESVRSECADLKPDVTDIQSTLVLHGWMMGSALAVTFGVLIQLLA
jgi:hypothetical protein